MTLKPIRQTGYGFTQGLRCEEIARVSDQFRQRFVDLYVAKLAVDKAQPDWRGSIDRIDLRQSFAAQPFALPHALGDTAVSDSEAGDNPDHQQG